jgi:hypothetical protein
MVKSTTMAYLGTKIGGTKIGSIKAGNIGMIAYNDPKGWFAPIDVFEAN